MKTKYIIHIVTAILVLSSCSIESGLNPQIPVITRGSMEIEVTEKNGNTEDEIKTIRFFVFKDPYTSPKLEVNRLFDESEFEITNATGNLNVSKLHVVLEVSKRRNSPNDKMVVVVANEPSSMTNILDQVTDPNELSNLKLAMSDFINSDHLSLKANTPMPMTSVVWTDKVYSTEAEARTNLVPMSLEHAVARVDIYVRKDDVIDTDIKLGLGTKVTLYNTYDNEYLIRHNSVEKEFGRLQTISSGLINKAWTLSVPNTALSDTSPICSFYTPERTCVTDKLILKVEATTMEGAIRQGQVTLDKAFDKNNIEKAINAIERNNIYKVVATINANEIVCSVNNWNSEDIITEL